MENYKQENIKRYNKSCGREIYLGKINKRKDKHLIKSLIPLASPNEKVLDAGGGGGFYTEILQEIMPLKVYALDICEESLKDRKETDIKVCGDMENMPFEDESFDRVFFFASLHHTANILKVLEEAKRVVRKGGHIVLYEPVSLPLYLKGKEIEYTGKGEFRFSILFLLDIIKYLNLRITYYSFRNYLPRFFSHSPKKIIPFMEFVFETSDKILSKIPLIKLLCGRIEIVLQK